MIKVAQSHAHVGCGRGGGGGHHSPLAAIKEAEPGHSPHPLTHIHPLSGRHFDFALDATMWCLYAYISLSALVFALSNRGSGYARCFLLAPVFVAVFIFRRVRDER